MAKIRSIRETSEQAKEQIEQGSTAYEEVAQARQTASFAQSQLQAAYAALEEASETDEEGNPSGDVDAAMAQVAAAQQMVDLADSMQRAAEQKLAVINDKKLETAESISGYLEGEEKNLDVLNQLAGMKFGSNAAAAAASLAARMNLGASVYNALMASMGMNGTAGSYSAAAGNGAGTGMASAGIHYAGGGMAANVGKSYGMSMTGSPADAIGSTAAGSGEPGKSNAGSNAGDVNGTPAAGLGGSGKADEGNTSATPTAGLGGTPDKGAGSNKAMPGMSTGLTGTSTGAAGTDLRAGLKSGTGSHGVGPYVGAQSDRLKQTYDKAAKEDLRSVTKEEEAAIWDYTGNGYLDMNHILVHGRADHTLSPELTSKRQAQIDHMTDAIGRHSLSYDTALYRGVDMHQLFGNDFSSYRSGAMSFSQLQQKWTDQYILNEPFTSTSVNEDVAHGFIRTHGFDGGMIHFHAPAGTQAIVVGDMSQLPHEKEVVLQRGVVYHIDHIEEVPNPQGYNNIHVHVTILGTTNGPGGENGTGANNGTAVGSGKGTGNGTAAGSGKGTGMGAGTGAHNSAGTGAGAGMHTGTGTGAGNGAGSGAGKGAGAGTHTGAGKGAGTGANSAPAAGSGPGGTQ